LLAEARDEFAAFKMPIHHAYDERWLTGQSRPRRDSPRHQPPASPPVS
jgi:hypothetical protein